MRTVTMVNKDLLAKASGADRGIVRNKDLSFVMGGRCCWNKRGLSLLSSHLSVDPMREPLYISFAFSPSIAFEQLDGVDSSTRMTGDMFMMVYKDCPADIMAFKTFLYKGQTNRLTSKLSALKGVFGCRNLDFMVGSYSAEAVSSQCVLNTCELDKTILTEDEDRLARGIKSSPLCLRLVKLT